MKKIILAILLSTFFLPMMQEQSFATEKEIPTITRISGRNRIETSIKSSAFLPSKRVILARQDDYADALSASSLPGQDPILLFPKGDISTAVLNHIKAMKVEEIIILGSEELITKKAEEELSKIPTVEKIQRIGGKNRYDTSLEIAKFSGKSNFFIARGDNYADALSASAFAASKESGILLTPGNHLYPKITDYLKTMDNRPILIGGESALSQRIEESLQDIGQKSVRIAGSNRYETAVNVAKNYKNPDKIYIASGENFPDALSASSLAKKDKAPILLTTKNTLPRSLAAYLKTISPKEIIIMGGENAINSFTEFQITSLFLKETNYIPGPYISQVYPVNIPMGCEASSMLMALQRKGYALETGLTEFVEKMPKTSRDPNLGFVGSPYKVVPYTYMTIHPAPLTKFALNYGKILDLSGSDIHVLKKELLMGNPIVFWGTYQFQSPRYFNYWNGKITAKGIDNAHVMTLVGYDGKTKEFIVADPYNPKTPKSSYEFRVKEEKVEQIYNLQKYAVVVR